MSDNRALPPTTFSGFLVSLASSAMVHLGEVADPSTGSTSVDLPMARHTVDLLGVLQEKTQGNLDDDETKLLDALIYELRMKYVAREKDAEA